MVEAERRKPARGSAKRITNSRQTKEETMKSGIAIFMTVLLLLGNTGFARAKKGSAGGARLGVDYIGMKKKGSWTEVSIAIQNQGSSEAKIECCEIYLESEDGFALAALSQGDLNTIIYNKAKTASTVGAFLAGALGLAGVVGDMDELIYAGIGLGAASGVANAIGNGSEDKNRRDIQLDNVMRAHKFPQGLKVAGKIYFPPKSKWPGSKTASALHLLYKVGGKENRVTLSLSEPAETQRPSTQKPNSVRRHNEPF